MKQKKERKKWKGLKTRYLLMGIVALMIASSSNCSCRGNQLAESDGDS